MRKRRRLVDKLMIMMCAVLIAGSAFFYAPIKVDASSVYNSSYSFTDSKAYSLRERELCNMYVQQNGVPITGSFQSDVYYRLNGNFHVDVSSNLPFSPRIFVYRYKNNLPPIFYVGVNDDNKYLNYSHDFGFEYIVNGSYLNTSFDNALNMYFFGDVGTYSFDVDTNITINSITPLTGEESASYQQGYNAGYSVGEQAGQDIGYSNGFEEGFVQGESQGYESGFQAGQDSVDTQSYYDAGYSAGYNVGYQSGYDEGYEEGYSDALKSVQGSSGEWQWYKFIGSPVSDVKKYGSSFYIAPYGLDDMEEYQSGSNGYYHNTVPSVYDGYSTINYLIPFDGVTEIDADSFLVEMTLSNLISGFDIDTGSGSFQNSLVSSEVQEVYLTFNGRKYFGNIGKYTSGSHGYVNFSFIVDDVIPPVELKHNCMALTFVVHNTMFANINASQYKFVGASCSPYVSFNVGATAQGYAFRVRPFIKNDSVSANIQNQTDELKGALSDGFDDITNGWDSSHGNSVNDNLSSGLNEYQTAEDSLWATATTGLKDFTFFDFESVPAMITGLSFVTSIMTTWFNNAGGASGVGIVLSVLFSVMLVSMVLGLYRMYQSAGHRAEVQKKRESRKKGK